MNSMCKVILLTAFLAAFSGHLLAADPITCQNAQSLDFNNTNLTGFWYEVARNPAPNATCIQLDTKVYQNATAAYFSIDIYQSANNESLYQNVQQSANFSVSTANTGYNVSLSNNGQAQQGQFIKILDVQNNFNLLIGCSYVNSTASVGFILSKIPITNGSQLASINNNASDYYTSFTKDAYFNVTQQGCFRSSASQSLPVISGVLALIMVLINRH